MFGRRERGRGGKGLFAEVVDEFEGEGAASALVAVDGTRHEDEVGAKEGLDSGKGNGSGLIDDDEFSLREFGGVRGMDVLDGLTVLSVEHVHPHDRPVHRGLCRLDQFIVEVLLPLELVKALEDELEEGAEVLGGGRGDKDVAVAKGQSGCHRQSHGRTLASSSGSSEGDSGAEVLVRGGLDEGEDGLCLVEGLGQLDDGSDGLVFLQGLFQLLQLLLRGRLCAGGLVVVIVVMVDGVVLPFAGLVLEELATRGLGEGAGVGGDGEDVELVVDDQRVGAGAEGEEEALVEATKGHSRRLRVEGVGVRAEALMDVHGHGVELFQTGHGLEEEHHQSSSLHGLDGAGQEVGGDGLKVLEDEHAKGVSEDLVGLCVVGVPDVRGVDKQVEWVLLVDLDRSL
mmetsp:Transcript_39642/g.66126  ORF Transcript_39642/g.66126 Transcript_39642/m.66126 type:complete len:398 (-) Transcript_39642:383-1576(-)